MDGDGIQFIVWLVFILCMVGYSVLSWYRRKENQELKMIELQIIAAENNLEYTEDGSSYLSRLRHRDLLPGTGVKIQNIVTRDHDGFVTHVFDASHVVGSGKSSRTEYLIGIAVEFDDWWCPRFDLDSKKFLDGVNFLDNMAKVKNEALPEWLRFNYSLFYKRQSMPYEVINLFQGKKELKRFLEISDFHLLAGGSKTVVYYRKGELESTEDFYTRMDGIGITLANTFDPHRGQAKRNTVLPPSQAEDVLDEIKLLKRKN